MRVLIINLPKSTARLDFQKQQLGRINLECDVIIAVGIDDLEEATYKRFSHTWQRLMRRTEVACFMSHLKTWQIVKEKNQPYLILEDDALLSRCVPELLNDFETPEFANNNCDLITLEIRNRKKIVGKSHQKLSCNAHLLDLFQDRTGAAAYVLWPSGANKLIDKYNKGKIGLADAFISSSYELNAFQVEPAASIQLDQCGNYQLDCGTKTESIITPTATKHPKSENVGSKIGFKLKRLQAQLLMGLRQLSVLYKSERRFVELNRKDFQ